MKKSEHHNDQETQKSKSDPLTVSLNRAIGFLMKSQSTRDGAWRSETYGSLKDGAAITALVVYAMSHVPEPLRKGHNVSIRRGVDFLNRGTTEEGYVGNPGGGPDYPTYATAMTLTAMDRLGWEISHSQKQKMVNYLISGQLAEPLEWKPDEDHYGGWDLLGTEKLPHHTPGTNISVTLYAIEALSRVSDDASQLALNRTRTWLARLQEQGGDRGFAFGPNPHANKAGWHDEKHQRPRSYGSTTCDGLRALVYCGANAKDPSVQKATRWLVDHDTVAVVPGFEKTEDTLWQQGLRYSYYASLAHCYTLRSLELGTSARRKKLSEILLKSQQLNGSWENASTQMREDDPLIATAFGVIALSELARTRSADPDAKPLSTPQ